MKDQEFTGWVEKILDPGQYGREFTVRDYKDDHDPNRPKYPNVLKFKVGNKIMNMLDNIREGDKVRVRYFVFGRSGYGQRGYYCIVNLNVAKDGGITLLEAAPRGGEQEEEQEDPEESGAEENLPF